MTERAGDTVTDQDTTARDEAVTKAAQWLAATHLHDWGLLDHEEKHRRIVLIEQQYGPFIEGLLHISLSDRMAVMGMEPVGFAHQACDITCVHYGVADA